METSDLVLLGLGGVGAWLLYDYVTTHSIVPTTAVAAPNNNVTVPVPVATPVVQMGPSVTAAPIVAAAAPVIAVTQAGLNNIAKWIYPQYVNAVATSLAAQGVDPASATYNQAVNVYETGHV